MSKVFTWIIAIFLVIVSFTFVFSQNLRSILLTPSGLKRTLIDIDFYRQSKSIIKNNVLSNTDLSDSEVVQLSDSLNTVVDNYDFQSQLETTLDEFFKQFKNNPENIVLYYDLSSLKNELAKNLSGQLEVSEEEILSSFPDQWKIDLTNATAGLNYISFIYRNNILIISVYVLLWLIFLILCLRSGRGYLSLFFMTLLIISISIFVQYLLFYFLHPADVLGMVSAGSSDDIANKALSQGQSGLQSLIENLINYLRQRFMSLLLWESIPGISVAIIGLIALRIIKIDNKKIPLND